MPTTRTYTISELAREFDITPRTIRYYEDQGLIAPSREGRNRVYSRRDRIRLKLALRGKRLGISLAEIREMIDMYDIGRGDEVHQLARFLDVLQKRRAALLQQREDIEAVLGEIDTFEAQCRQMLASQGDTLAAGVERVRAKA
ncbi:transcriptional regulator, MerR family [Oryzomicrobium terrae]|uniref:Transcriptional regulator, MerR family n=1 Tax=Oryzomicrobium terrae TaxID=1735038 RepID=A0A5C1E5U4_9RHOO|nr:MerR family DNA-binding transcriptional regulator [Oryzomicrobium terrae]QEL63657.1 transcriptional regulator, MerR family [Oryzomicrobium terrae]